MTRARGSEGMAEVEEEEKTSNALKRTSFKDLTGDWNGPDDLAPAQVDKIWDTVESWIYGWQSHAGKSTVGGFLNYCQSYCETVEEDYEVELWMLNLVAHHVLLDKSWLETADAAKDWGNALLSEDWKVPPPLWARHREDKWMLEGKDKENTEESLEILPTSPLDPNWGKGLPAPTPVVAAPSTPMWRPWEEEEEKEIVNLSAAVQKRKRRSPAAKARSRQRLQQWQEKKDRSRLKSERRTTPCKPSVQWRSTRLADRLDSNHVKMDMARLLAESRTTPLKSVKQIRSAHLLQKLDKYHFDVEELTNVETLEEESTVFFSNHSQSSMLPQLTSSSETLHKTSPSTNLKVISPVKNLDKVCPSCCARTMPITSE